MRRRRTIRSDIWPSFSWTTLDGRRHRISAAHVQDKSEKVFSRLLPHASLQPISHPIPPWEAASVGGAGRVNSRTSTAIPVEPEIQHKSLGEWVVSSRSNTAKTSERLHGQTEPASRICPSWRENLPFEVSVEFETVATNRGACYPCNPRKIFRFPAAVTLEPGGLGDAVIPSTHC
jgi:hypothetical protein